MNSKTLTQRKTRSDKGKKRDHISKTRSDKGKRQGPRTKSEPKPKLSKCPKCGNKKSLTPCIRYDPELMYYHCSNCGHNIRDRAEVAKIIKARGGLNK